jgi:hypothetical protein
MAFPKGVLKPAALAAVSVGALLLTEPAFAWHGGGPGGLHGGGLRGPVGGGFHPMMRAAPGGVVAGRYGHLNNGYWNNGQWHNGNWNHHRGPCWPNGCWWGGWGGGYPYYGWGVAPFWGWDSGYYYATPVYTQCYIRRVHVHTRHGWRWRRVRYCYQ